MLFTYPVLEVICFELINLLGGLSYPVRLLRLFTYPQIIDVVRLVLN